MTKKILVSGYWTSLVFDFGLWTLDIGLLLVLCAVSSFAQESRCVLKLAELPNAAELFGFRMGMTTVQVKTRVPRVAFGPVNESGLSKASISPDFDPQMNKRTFAGIRTISFDFLDDHLTSLWLGYDSSFKWQTVPDFVKGISQSMHLPQVWEPWKTRGRQLKCADFQLTVGIVSEGPSFHIIDESAERNIAERRQALEDQNAAAGETETVELVGNKKDKTYYIKGCVPESDIKQEDRVVFDSREAADKAGYKLARNCE